MAKFEIPDQNLSAFIPDEGVPFTGQPGAGDQVVFVRKGSTLYQIPKTQYAGDVSKLPVINPGIEGLNWLGAKPQQTDINTFSQLTANPVFGEVITRSKSATNPQGSDVTSSIYGSLSKSPSIQQVQENARIYNEQTGGQVTPPKPGTNTNPNNLTPEQQTSFTNQLNQATQALMSIQKQLGGQGTGQTTTGATSTGQTTTGATTGATTTGGITGTPTYGNAQTSKQQLELMAMFGFDPADYAKEMADVKTATDKINTFFSTKKTAEQILNEEFQKRGIETKTKLVQDMDKVIQEQNNILEDLPKDIQISLANVGVTQAQLNRLVAAESEPKVKVLDRLLRDRNATASELNTAISFAEKFAGTRLDDQASNLSALEWNLNSEKGDLTAIESKKKDYLNAVISDRKAIMDVALEAAKNGADDSMIDSILASTSQKDAIKTAGDVLQQAQPQIIGDNVNGYQIVDKKTGVATPIVGAGATPNPQYVFSLPDGTAIDASTPKGIELWKQKYKEATGQDLTYAVAYQNLVNNKVNASVAKQFLNQAGLEEQGTTKPISDQDLTSVISNKTVTDEQKQAIVSSGKIVDEKDNTYTLTPEQINKVKDSMKGVWEKFTSWLGF